jgi:hypothetical protein
MMDPLLLLAYFALPATITLIAFIGLKLHERNAPPVANPIGDASADRLEIISFTTAGQPPAPKADVADPSEKPSVGEKV